MAMYTNFLKNELGYSVEDILNTVYTVEEESELGYINIIDNGTDNVHSLKDLKLLYKYSHVN